MLLNIELSYLKTVVIGHTTISLEVNGIVTKLSSLDGRFVAIN